MSHLSGPIKKVIKNAFRLNDHEEVLIVTDEDKLKISKEFAKGLKEEGAIVNTYLLTEECRPYEKLTPFLESAIPEVDILIYLLKGLVKEKPLRSGMVQLGRKNGRVCMMPAVTEEILERTLDIDYDELAEFTGKLSNALKDSEEVTIENDKGTDISFSLKGREFEDDVGKVTRRGGYGNLPAGETFTAPVEKTFTGAIHFKFISDFNSGRGFFKFKEGEVVEYGGVDSELEEIMQKKENRTIGEFGMGTNPNARATPNFLEAEKSRGTVHFAIGDSYGLGKNKSEYHFDFLVENPTVITDDKVIMEKGKFKI